jgi:5-methylcytosine-specific restriction protein A
MDFNERIHKAIKESVEKCNYTPHQFIQMVNEYGAIETAKKLINSSKPSVGYVKLFEKNRLDLTVENIVLEEEWSKLFTEDELKKARQRLKEFNFDPFSSKNVSRWSIDELKACVDAYLEMLYKQQNNIEFNKSKYNEKLRELELSKRTKASVEYRMQYISSVLFNLDLKILQGYLPANNIGINTINQIISILEENPLFYKCNENDINENISKLLKIGKLHKPKGVAKPNKKESSFQTYERSPAVKAYVLQRANSRCELCGNLTFLTINETYYLEVHHIISLSENGADTTANTVGLCPQCHRELHYGKNKLEKTTSLIGKYD